MHSAIQAQVRMNKKSIFRSKLKSETYAESLYQKSSFAADTKRRIKN